MTAPIEEQHRANMNGLAHGIDEILNGKRQIGIPGKVGFVLLVCEFGKIDGGRVNYISNASRPDMMAMMREYLARADGTYHEKGGRA